MFDYERVLRDLSPFYQSVVLVGGWAPYIYMRYLWNQDVPNVRMTTDVDIGILAGEKYEKHIQEVFLEKGYSVKHVSTGHRWPYQFVLPLEGRELKIDFIGDSNSAKQIQRQILGEEVILNLFDDFNFLLSDLLYIQTEWGKFYVPRPERYLIYKVISFLDEPAGRQRDVMMFYFCFSRCRKRAELELALKSFCKEALVKKVVKGLKLKFKHESSPAVLEIRKSLAPFGFYDTEAEIFNEMKAFIKCCSLIS